MSFPIADFERFVDDLLPDDEALLTVDDIARLISRLRAFFDRYTMTDAQKAAFAEQLLNPVLRSTTLTPAERRDVMEKWASAFGVEIEWTN